jgi:hypothetical protein
LWYLHIMFSDHIYPLKLGLHYTFCFVLWFWWEWDLNSGLHICKAGVLLLEPHLQSFTTLLFTHIFWSSIPGLRTYHRHTCRQCTWQCLSLCVACWHFLLWGTLVLQFTSASVFPALCSTLCSLGPWHTQLVKANQAMADVSLQWINSPFLFCKTRDFLNLFVVCLIFFFCFLNLNSAYSETIETIDIQISKGKNQV